MNLEMVSEEETSARRRRIHKLVLMLVGDFVAILAIVFGYAGFMEWAAAVPFIVVGWGVSFYILWQAFLKKSVAEK